MVYEELTAYSNFVKAVLSSADESSEFSKVVITKVSVKGEENFQLARYKNNQVFHLNLAISGLNSWLDVEERHFRDVNIFFAGKTISIKVGKKSTHKKVSNNDLVAKGDTSHNKAKNYILAEGEDIPALRDLGVFDANNRIIKSKYDKYKQINRFVEIIDDYFGANDMDNLTILDFGCGKSYLTFVVYYYFKVKRGKNVRIIGYDLKKDVVDHCNEIAKSYGYVSLNFIHADVSRDVLYDDKIDMVISLHACNTATDYALNYAISHGAKYIFSVPCCQHEVNSSIKEAGDLDLLLKYGIIKERVSALLTDAMRAEILEAYGYKVDVMEFVDLAHSPKNIMLRCKRAGIVSKEKLSRVEALKAKYGFDFTLMDIIK